MKLNPTLVKKSKVSTNATQTAKKNEFKIAVKVD